MPDEAALEELLSQPTPSLVQAMAGIEGDILIVGAGGKMGPSLARLALRGSQEAGRRRRVIALARFGHSALRAALEHDGIDTLECDLLDRGSVERLPEVPNLLYLVGQKFGTSDDSART